MGSRLKVYKNFYGIRKGIIIMRNVKRLISLIAVLTLLFSMTTIAFAKGIEEVKDITKSSIYYDSISQYTGISVEELKIIEAKHGDLTEIYGIHIDESRLSDSSGLERASRSASVDSGRKVEAMSPEDYEDLKASLDDGDILVTKDAWTVNVNHGHCALVDDVFSSGRIDIVEAFKPGTQSDGYTLEKEHDHWKDYNRVRVYYPTRASRRQRDDAGTYAWRNLQGKGYDAFAEVYTSRFLNCATLVWRAYKSEGIELQTSLFYLNKNVKWYTVYPDDIVTDSGNTLRFQVNWGGGDHKW